MVSGRWIGAFALGLALARDAGAVGGVLSTAQDPATVVEARFAIALSRARTTRWASLRVERFPGAMAWLLPVRPGARVDEVSDAWFEALEVATAPRIVGSCGGSPPQVSIVRSTVHEPTAAALHVATVAGADELRAFAKDWGLEVPAETASRFEVLEGRGFSFVGLVYGGSSDRTLTRTVRVTDDAFPAVPLFLTSAPASKTALRVAAFLVAESRTRVGSGEEREIDPRAVSFGDGGATNYDELLLADLLAHGGKSWVVEAADHALLFDGVRGPAGAGTIAPLVATYRERAAAYGDQTDDPDLALTGLDPSATWITRVAGIVPAREFGDDLAVTMTTSTPQSPFVVAGGGSRCDAGAEGGFVGPPVMPPPTSPDAGSSGPDFPPGSTTTGGVTTGGQDPVAGGAYPVSGDVSCACSPGASDGTEGDSCSRSDQGDSSSSGGCDGSASDSTDDSDGCDASSSDSSDDGGGCDGGGSDDTSGDGCSGDGSGDSSGDGAGCDSGSSSDSDAKCGVARHKRRGRTRTSAVAFALVAIVFPLRRLTRPRR
jgi:hypothetical protein